MIDDLRLTIDDSKMNDKCAIRLFNRQSSIVNRQSLRGRRRVTRGVGAALLLLSLLGASPAQAEEIDRVLAAVNGKVITESDLRIARDLNSLLVFGKDEQGGEVSRQEQIGRLVDLELIRQELTNFPLDPEEQSGIEARVEELKAGYAEIGGLEPLLKRLGLQAAELQEYLRLQASILRFVNLRFRPFVSVSPDEVSAYYRDRLAPKLKGAGVPVPPVEEVSAKIEELLKEAKVNTALDDWIKELRIHSRIELLAPAEFGVRPGGAPESSPGQANIVRQVSPGRERVSNGWLCQGTLAWERGRLARRKKTITGSKTRDMISARETRAVPGLPASSTVGRPREPRESGAEREKALQGRHMLCRPFGAVFREGGKAWRA